MLIILDLGANDGCSIIKFRKNNLYYDLQCNPQDYLGCMVFMMKQVENKGYTTTNPFPMRNDIIPKHIRL